MIRGDVIQPPPHRVPIPIHFWLDALTFRTGDSGHEIAITRRIHLARRWNHALHGHPALADGRIAVNPDVIVPGGGHFIDALILEKVDGRWLIDMSMEGEGTLYPITGEAIATPSA
jgi:hypothetical protein